MMKSKECPKCGSKEIKYKNDTSHCNSCGLNFCCFISKVSTETEKEVK